MRLNSGDYKSGFNLLVFGLGQTVGAWHAYLRLMNIWYWVLLHTSCKNCSMAFVGEFSYVVRLQEGCVWIKAGRKGRIRVQSYSCGSRIELDCRNC